MSKNSVIKDISLKSYDDIFSRQRTLSVKTTAVPLTDFSVPVHPPVFSSLISFDKCRVILLNAPILLSGLFADVLRS